MRITELFLEIINPVFFADPLGALVGKGLTSSGIFNPKWIGDKTIGQKYFVFIFFDCFSKGGSAAVFMASYLTMVFGGCYYKMFLSLVITVVEGVTLEFDNLFITMTVILGYFYDTHGSGLWITE